MTRATPEVRVVVASNRPDVLERLLLSSLRRQSLAHAVRVVDARAEGHASAAAALNAGAAGGDEPYLLFAHQDVAFDDPDFLARAVALMRALPDLAVAGPVGTIGARWGRRRPVGRFTMGEPPAEVTLGPLGAPTPVTTLDELMLFVPRAWFARQPFDADACPGWHMYGVDYCLSALARGGVPYALPLRVYHLSGGTLDADYYRTLARVARKHRARHRALPTMSESWPTLLPAALQKPWHRVKAAARYALWHGAGIG